MCCCVESRADLKPIFSLFFFELSISPPLAPPPAMPHPLKTDIDNSTLTRPISSLIVINYNGKCLRHNDHDKYYND